jgi:ABC-type uncharacterized transport system substrate-binding protein
MPDQPAKMIVVQSAMLLDAVQSVLTTVFRCYEQPRKFELVLPLNSAKALGIRIPQTVLPRAHRVIE